MGVSLQEVLQLPPEVLSVLREAHVNTAQVVCMNSMKLVIPKKDSKRCGDTLTPESIHTKDESKRGSAFAFIFGGN